jgi:small subunit ribosomal protein S17
MAETTNTPAPQKPAGPGPRKLIGVVTRDKTLKTRRVEVSRREQHPKYGKFVKKRTICYIHDEKNESHLGDTVEIQESRPVDTASK